MYYNEKEDGRREVKAVCKMPPAAFAACGLCKRRKMAKKRQAQQKGKQDEKVRLEDALQKDVLEKLRQAKQELAAAEAEKRGRKKNGKEKNGSSASGTNRLRNYWKNPIWIGNDIKAKKDGNRTGSRFHATACPIYDALIFICRMQGNSSFVRGKRMISGITKKEWPGHGK